LSDWGKHRWGDVYSIHQTSNALNFSPISFITSSDRSCKKRRLWNCVWYSCHTIATATHWLYCSIALAKPTVCTQTRPPQYKDPKWVL
jgi:hypothetical protein